MKSLTIGEVSRRVGMATSTIRYYERLGILSTPDRISGKRRYSDDVISLLLAIQTAKQAGFTLAEIKTFMRGFPAGTPLSQRWRNMASAKIVELDTQIEQARRMKRLLRDGLECECLDLTTCRIVSGSHSQKSNK